MRPSVRHTIRVPIVLLAVLLSAPTATVALSPTPITELRVEWEQVSRGNRAIVRGYVYDEHQMRAANVRLRVEQLDAGARPVATRTVFVVGTSEYRHRGCVEATVPAAGATSRVPG